MKFRIKMVQLVDYNDSHFSALTSYILDEEQAQFSRTPKEVLNDSESLAAENKNFYSILHNDLPVGFFALDCTLNRWYKPQNDKVALLRSLTINPKFQGKGIAKETMLQLPNLVKEKFPKVEEIGFGVNFKNKNAYQLYLKTGYEDKGKIFEGPKGPQHIMTKEI